MQRFEGASKDTASLQLTSKVPSAWTLEILPGYFLDRPLRQNRPVNDGNCNVNAESVPVSRLHARADAHAAPRRAAGTGTGSAPGTAPAAALDLDARGLDVALLIAVVEDDIASAVPMHALDRSRVKFTSVLEFGLAFVSFSGRRRALWAPGPAPRAAPRPRPTTQDLDPF